MHKLTRRQLDDVFPTIVRYLGVVIILILMYKSITDKEVKYPGMYAAASGMILFKTVVVSNGNKK